MTEHEASRTLVKSPPELWAELSDQVSLAGHLTEPFGEIRITRLEPETAVAWEGERASGTVRIEPSGWGTRVTLTARAVQAHPVEAAGQPAPRAPEAAPLPPPPGPLPPVEAEPHPPATPRRPRRSLRARLRDWLGGKAAPAQDEPPAPESEIGPPLSAPPAAAAEPAPAAAPARSATTPPQPDAAITPAIDAVLVGVLDRLGAAHHRPFSRA